METRSNECMTEDEQFAACLLVVGYPPTKPSLRWNDRGQATPSREYSWRDPNWMREVNKFYRDMRGIDVRYHCEPAMSDFTYAFTKWLDRQTRERYHGER